MSRSDETEGVFALLTLLLLPVSIIIHGILLKIMWGWFMVPLGLQPIGAAHALGVGVLIGMFTARTHSNKNESAVSAFLSMLLRPLFYLIFGAIFHAFM